MKTLLRYLACFSLLSLTQVTMADDTDLYLDPNSSIGSEPLVMFAIDYRSNLTSTICADASSTSCAAAEYFRASEYTNVVDAITAIGANKLTFFDIIRLSLRQVFNKLESDGTAVKLGLMMNHNANNCAGPSATTCSNGGYVLMGFNTLQDDPDTTLVDEGAETRELFLGKLDAVPLPQGSLSHSFQGKELYFEFFRYLTGGNVYNGHNGYDDFDDPGGNSVNLDAEYPDLAWDSSIETGGIGNKSYVSPLTEQCSKIFMINMMFQVSQAEDQSDTAITDTAANGGMGGINLTGRNNSFDTVIKYLRDNDLDGDVDGEQSVISYFVVAESSVNTTTRSYADAGGTGEPLVLDEDPQELVDTIADIFDQILSVSTTFVAASVPVNVFNRSESLDNVFIALFEVDELAAPFWEGNLKKLKIAEITVTDDNGTPIDTSDDTTETAISLVDAQATPIEAIAADGRIKYEALTYWTDSATLPAATPDTQEVTGRDGRIVNRGGAGQQIPGYDGLTGPGLLNTDTDARQLFYEPSVYVNGFLNDLTPLNVDATTITALKTELGAADDAEAEKLISYARGLDIDDDDLDGSTSDARPWILGDPLHSRPLPINYGGIGSYDEDNPAIYIAMAAQDGFMHFFRNTNADGTEAGEEVWAFMPREVMDKLSVYEADTDLENHPYMVDGAPSVYIEDDNGDGDVDYTSGERAILFFGMRRGGSSYYALDVSNPEDPHLLWKIDNTTTNFTELGQSWSQPRVGLVDTDGSGTGNDPFPVIYFGGGYDTAKDARTSTAPTTADTAGNAFYVVNVYDGSLVWKAVQSGTATTNTYVHAGLTDSIPSDITIVDTDGDGLTDRAVFGDTGGKVWRVDTHEAIANWQISLLGSFGSEVTKSEDRRFFHRPDFVPSLDGPGTSGKFDGVVIGSGDRPNPLDRPVDHATVDNYLFMIKDRETGPATAAAPVADRNLVLTDLLDVTDNCLQSSDEATCDPDSKLANGWRLQLAQGTGEKVLSTPLTLSNTIFVTSFLPLGQSVDVVDEGGTDPATCGPSEGEGLLYAMKLNDATAVYNYNEYNDTTDADGDGIFDETLDASDRFTELASAGIPADVVGLNFGGQSYILPPDLGPRKAGVGNLIRTFWYKVEDND